MCCNHPGLRWFEGVQFFILPYHGALKAWMFIPVDLWWGLSLYSLRVPTFLVTLSGFVLFAVFLRRVFSARVSLLVVAMMTLNPGMILIARQDIGEIALYFFCMAGMLYCLQAGLERERKLAWVGAAIFLLLGGFHRLNFFWFSLPLLFACFLFFPRHRIKCVALAALLSLEGWYLLRQSGISPGSELFGTGFFTRLDAGVRALNGLLSGATVVERIFLSDALPNGFGVLWAYALAVVVVLMFLQRRHLHNPWFRVIGLLFAGTFLFFLASTRAYRYWHIFPAWVCLMVLLATLIGTGEWRGKWGRWWPAFYLPLLVMYGTVFYEYEFRSRTTPARFVFSDAVMKLVTECVAPGVRCVDVDTYTFTHLMALLPDRNQYGILPIMPKIKWEDTRNDILPLVLDPKNRFVLLAEEQKFWVTGGDHLQERLEQEGIVATNVKDITDSLGHVMYHLVQFNYSPALMPSPRGSATP